ncbi:M20/M25/M40 family metallo-hydrolase [Tenacibaculum sp. MEBiC06402]|uniref:M20/M25/M40 family metallo-hydrolase n=1 Tax=unclassified Tenacibaculum TaxID=2635139 RepID=UPI003B99FEF2
MKNKNFINNYVFILLFSLFISVHSQQKESMFYATMKTLDATELQKNHPNEIIIIESKDEFSAVMLTNHAAEELHHKVLVHGPGFIYESSRENALKAINRTKRYKSKAKTSSKASLQAFSITQDALVNQSLNLVNNLNIEAQILELQAYGTRYHTTNSARQAVLELKTKWESMASGRNDVSVRIVNHTSTNMPSVVMTITGTELPDEYVIIGGHIDSTASGNNTTNAPGADDNASGIATFTEAARVLFEMNYQPKRTIEFMAFAAEEVGLRGSREIAEDYRNRNVNVISYLQLDMTNYKGSTNDIYISTDSYNDDTLNDFLIELMNYYNASGTHKLTYGTSSCNYGCSDHYSWAQEGYNVAFPFEATFRQSNPNIHTTRDTYDRSPTPNATHAAKFAKLALEYLIEISNAPTTTPPVDTCSQTISNFPYGESFENSLGSWSQDINDDLDFTRDSGGTPSSNTGPSNGASGSFYLYVEASGEGSGFPNKQAILNSPCFDLSSLNNPKFDFNYHMYGSAVNSLKLEARLEGETNWSTLFLENGNQGNTWNEASINLNTYTNESSVQFRFVVTTGSGSSGWQSDIAIDAINIKSEVSDPDPDPNPTCDSLNFTNYTISSFSNQDSNGNYSVENAGNSLVLTNNTWKYINYPYTITSQTVIEFDFSSTNQGEIHGIGFENDNSLTSSRYFKVHGTQNYGVTNYDNYTSGNATYIIPVGSFYTGSMDRLVFINDNDAGSGNNSSFSNVKIYEGSCGNSIQNRSVQAVNTVYLGNEDENSPFELIISPNPSSDLFHIKLQGSSNKEVQLLLYTIEGKEILNKKLDNNELLISAKELNLSSGIYLIKLRNTKKEISSKKLIVK